MKVILLNGISEIRNSNKYNIVVYVINYSQELTLQSHYHSGKKTTSDSSFSSYHKKTNVRYL